MRSRFVILLAALAVLASCGNDDTATNPPPLAQPDTTTPRDNQEAEEAALWLSGELLAPQDLYETIRDDLAVIRSEYLDSIPETGTTFFPIWVVTEIIIYPDEVTWEKLRNHEPNAVDSLNTVFHATELDSLRIGVHLLGIITFEGRLHPQRLSEIYAAQHGVIFAEPNGYAGDWSNVYPWEHNGKMTYLFRLGGGDCPSGCTENTFWYFRRVAGQTDYVGTFVWPGDPEPNWWAEAKAAFLYFRTGS
ncbi:MAG: hypothetical protein OEX18_10975 [Candidatus Krumholzibacteria bacterium]|nr:hypothetical protein [Candidatus Krumholzibacteria bacterium]MDH4337782.1 hypothetical protein [Candidatus Krumholzibacteria bacterium]MDH5270836.1 hypothetical protein [Candidatus Krumholzibacteria bacterium]MDH5627387.1 hypothetical protein [Candidatus Krumholzibacteria bacterium]